MKAAIQSNDVAHLAELIASQEADLAARRAALEADLTATTDATRHAAAQKALDALDEEIRNAAQRKINSLQSDLAASDARSAEQRTQLIGSLTQSPLSNEISLELFRLQRDEETTRTLYQSYLTKLRQVEQQTDFAVPDSRVIALATPPSEPSFPPKKVIFAGSILFALGLGIGLAFLRENLIGGITSEEQIEGLTGFPMIAGVPVYRGSGAVARPDRAIVTQPLSPFSEAIRRIQIGVETYLPGGKQCIFVTSSLPGEGKTTIALALARQFAMTGTSTLLIDGDLRHPSIQKLLAAPKKPGLVGFLDASAGSAPDQISMVTEADTGLTCLLGGEASKIATDALLLSTRFGQMMRFAKQSFDVVIVDTSPIGLVVDASIVARHCDLGIFVVRHASTGQRAVLSGLRELTRRQDLQVCTVLNLIKDADGPGYEHLRKYAGYFR